MSHERYMPVYHDASGEGYGMLDAEMRQDDEGEWMRYHEVTLIEHQETENGKLEHCSRCEAVINPIDKWCSGCAGKIKR